MRAKNKLWTLEEESELAWSTQPTFCGSPIPTPFILLRCCVPRVPIKSFNTLVAFHVISSPFGTRHQFTSLQKHHRFTCTSSTQTNKTPRDKARKDIELQFLGSSSFLLSSNWKLHFSMDIGLLNFAGYVCIFALIVEFRGSSALISTPDINQQDSKAIAFSVV
ncbi:hypothetical protein L2E82_01906 [Cichorium intybus]|uniref:Uncharacterized protein n=1 Tax=Cichorium intybus TaxID=13427 RepID=A0ACB9H0Z1_CICIN|nr:hypothetical protein L2E82_01906 [Cichorium intybus]